LGNWRDAVNFYVKAIHIVRKYRSIPSFTLIERESDIRVREIVSQLRSRFSQEVKTRHQIVLFMEESTGWGAFLHDGYS
jgi:hypothetical protein